MIKPPEPLWIMRVQLVRINPHHVPEYTVLSSHDLRLEYLNDGFLLVALLLRKEYFFDAFGVIVHEYSCFCKSVQHSFRANPIGVGKSFPL